MLRQGIITKSSSPYQDLLVLKPDKNSALNDCTPDSNWPIPNITEILRRIGQVKPKLFGIMDLTQGYHQAPLEHNTKAFTAFITFSGENELHIQRIMATIVLVGLIYMMCEMYIDDCIVFADANHEFVPRLDSALGRFRKHNLFLKASKCAFGFKEREFVGKVVSEAGLKVSQQRIQAVLNFPLPTIFN